MTRDPRVDWDAVERLVHEACRRGDITVSRGAEILGITLRTWRDRSAELFAEGDAALIDARLAVTTLDPGEPDRCADCGGAYHGPICRATTLDLHPEEPR